MIPEKTKQMLRKQHYALVGEDAAIQVCKYTKESIRGQDFCYKQKFYGINSNQCCQMSPCTMFCSHKCIFCWRPVEKTIGTEMNGKIMKPSELIDGCIKEQIRMIKGFKGSKSYNKKRFEEAQNIKHFAISLSGEPTIYPKLPELIKKLDKRKITSFVVSNGENPKMIKKINPTQLYISLDAPNEILFNRIDRPCRGYGWKNLIKTLKILKTKKSRTCLRLTLMRGLNMCEPENYANLIKMANPLFVEVKSYMAVGFSRQRFGEPKCVEIMPSHQEVKKFAKEIGKYCGYSLVDEKKNSRVVLLMKKKDLGKKKIRF